MRKLSAILILLHMATVCLCQEKSSADGKYMITLDLGAAICSKTMRVDVGRKVREHWSLEGGSAIDFSKAITTLSQEERDHYNEFLTGDKEQETSDMDMIKMDMKLKYWITETFKGGHIMAGLRHGNRQGTECIIGAGYTFGLWRGLKCSLSYETGLRRLEDNGIRMTLSFTY